LIYILQLHLNMKFSSNGIKDYIPLWLFNMWHLKILVKLCKWYYSADFENPRQLRLSSVTWHRSSSHFETVWAYILWTTPPIMGLMTPLISSTHFYSTWNALISCMKCFKTHCMFANYLTSSEGKYICSKLFYNWSWMDYVVL
jgi:hypothetical protein